MENDTAIFHFQQSSITFLNFNSLEFQDIKFVVNTQSTDASNLIMKNGSEVNITDVDAVDATETQQTAGKLARIDI